MNSITERWVKTLRAELLDRTLIWNRTHLHHSLHEYERHYNLHRTTDHSPPRHPCKPSPKPLNPTSTSRSHRDRPSSSRYIRRRR